MDVLSIDCLGPDFEALSWQRSMECNPTAPQDRRAADSVLFG